MVANEDERLCRWCKHRAVMFVGADYCSVVCWEAELLATPAQFNACGGEQDAIARVLARRIPFDPQPEHGWNHMGGAWFCRGEHPKAETCGAHAFEIPCPHGVVGAGVTVEHDATLGWVWVVEEGQAA